MNADHRSSSTALIASGCGLGQSAATAKALRRWREQISVPALQCAPLVLAICSALAAPLGLLLHRRPFCLHVYALDDRSTGLLLAVADSLFGGCTLHTWIELAANPKATAAGCSDGLLLLDGFDQADQAQRGDAARALWSDEGNRKPLQSRGDAVTLSAGTTLFNEALALAPAGRGKLWLLNIPGDEGRGNGIFESFRSDDEPGLMVGDAMRSDGASGLAWLSYLGRLDDSVIARFAATFDGARPASATPPRCGDIWQCFQLLGIAGELATAQGLTCWPSGAAVEAIGRCMAACGRAGMARLRGGL